MTPATPVMPQKMARLVRAIYFLLFFFLLFLFLLFFRLPPYLAYLVNGTLSSASLRTYVDPFPEKTKEGAPVIIAKFRSSPKRVKESFVIVVVTCYFFLLSINKQ